MELRPGIWKAAWVAILTTASATLSAQWAISTKHVELVKPERRLQFSADIPVLTMGGKASVRKRINVALQAACDVDGMIGEALLQGKTSGPSSGDPGSLPRKAQPGSTEEEEERFSDDWDIVFTKGINNGKLLSFYILQFSQAGGAATGHANGIGCTFDATTGRSLELGDLLIDGYEPRLYELLREHVHDPSDLWEDWRAKIETVSFGFFLSKSGLVASFPKYGSSRICGVSR